MGNVFRLLRSLVGVHGDGGADGASADGSSAADADADAAPDAARRESRAKARAWRTESASRNGMSLTDDVSMPALDALARDEDEDDGRRERLRPRMEANRLRLSPPSNRDATRDDICVRVCACVCAICCLLSAVCTCVAPRNEKRFELN